MADFPNRNYAKGDLVFEEGAVGHEAVKAFSRCFRIDPEIIKEKFVQMEKSNLLEFTMTSTGKKAVKTNRNIEELL